MKTTLILIGLFVLISCADGNRIFRDGVDGKDGQSGGSCKVSPAVDGSGSLITCPDGSTSFVKNGSNGVDGSNGTDGTNGTSVELIKLCPNVTGSYAGSYPEYAFRVGNALYAVYYDKKESGLVQLYPGRYSSTTPGANCEFTVGADGFTLSNQVLYGQT